MAYKLNCSHSIMQTLLKTSLDKLSEANDIHKYALICCTLDRILVENPKEYKKAFKRRKKTLSNIRSSIPTIRKIYPNDFKLLDSNK